MDTLVNLAKVLRSKNSGPFAITLDILFDDHDIYKRVVKSNTISVENLSRLYKTDPDEITEIVFFEKALGIKITMNRKISSGSGGDRDVYGAQQHAPLFDIRIP